MSLILNSLSSGFEPEMGVYSNVEVSGYIPGHPDASDFLVLTHVRLSLSVGHSPSDAGFDARDRLVTRLTSQDFADKLKVLLNDV